MTNAPVKKSELIQVERTKKKKKKRKKKKKVEGQNPLVKAFKKKKKKDMPIPKVA